MFPPVGVTTQCFLSPSRTRSSTLGRGARVLRRACGERSPVLRCGPERVIGIVLGGGAEHWNHPTDVFLWLLCRSHISARVSGGGGVNEGFNSFLSRAVIELNSHRRAGASAHHQPFPPISGSRRVRLRVSESPPSFGCLFRRQRRQETLTPPRPRG